MTEETRDEDCPFCREPVFQVEPGKKAEDYCQCDGALERLARINAMERVERLEKELVKAKKALVHHLCPACHGAGEFNDSTEGGLTVQCDCAVNLAGAWLSTKKLLATAIALLRKAEPGTFISTMTGVRGGGQTYQEINEFLKEQGYRHG